MAKKRLRVVVLLSGKGRTLNNLLHYSDDGELAVDIVGVVASRPGVFGLRIAEGRDLPTAVVRPASFSNEEKFSIALTRKIKEWNPDLVVMAGFNVFYRIPPEFTGKVMNIHPALLPAFGGKGFYGKKVHQAVLAAKVKESGCTVHFVDNVYDHGPVILQRKVPVQPGDTPEKLAARIFEEECMAYPEAIALFATERLKVDVEGKVKILEREEW